MNVCYWENDEKIGKVFIPGCMGGAVYGPDGCTCIQTKDKPNDISIAWDRIDRLEKSIRKLEAFIHRHCKNTI